MCVCVCEFIYVGDCDVCLLVSWKEIVWARRFGSDMAKWSSGPLFFSLSHTLTESTL